MPLTWFEQFPTTPVGDVRRTTPDFFYLNEAQDDMIKSSYQVGRLNITPFAKISLESWLFPAPHCLLPYGLYSQVDCYYNGLNVLNLLVVIR